jgi:lipid II:glycine glycyltransferase (peptidoglycan interpeptide bridge formation enzyme)
MQWFRNLIGCLGDKMEIHVAYAKETPVAAMLTLRYKQAMVYKYGCSDRRFDALGGMQLLFWRAIQQGSRDGMLDFDLGRTDADNEGLLAFKDRLGAHREPLAYLEFPRRRQAIGERSSAIRSYVCSYAPDLVLAATGKLLYRYMG